MSAPTIPDASMAISLLVVSSFQSLMTSRRARWVMVQKRNMIQTALSRALIVFTILATCVVSLAKCVKKLPKSMKNGAPGG